MTDAQEDLCGDGGCIRVITGITDTCAKAGGELGDVAKAGDHIWAHYKGMLENGNVFDQSHGKPHREPHGFDFVLGGQQVIRGWDEGFQGMRVGQTATLKLRADYGYGAQGAGDAIPPNATLIFEVQLNGINIQ